MSGWDATGRLREHWGRVGGRDKLAELTGIAGSTLSNYNTGAKRLGPRNGWRIAEALGVTIYDIGAPPDRELEARAVSVLDRLAALEDELAQTRRELDELRRHQGDAE